MAEDDKCLPPPLICPDLSWDPFRGWPRRTRILASWPGYRRTPLYPSSEETPQEAGPKLCRPLPEGVSEILIGQDRWQVNLDINHFSPEEISIKTKEGYLEITGKHEERQDEHGIVSRYFTRKYKLPAGIDLQHIRSSLSGDGVLSVEGPLPASSSSAEIVIPIQVEDELKARVQVEDKTEDVTGGEGIGEKQASETEGLQSPPTQGTSDQPEGGEQPQQALAAQSESTVEQGVELQAGPEERAAISGGEEVPVEPEGDTAKEQVDPKPAQEDMAQEQQEASGDQEDPAAPDAGAEGHRELIDPAPETEPQQDAAGEPAHESTETASAEDPEPAPSQEPPNPEEPQPSASQEPPNPIEPQPAPSQEALSPEDREPASSQEAPGSEEPQPAPSQEAPGSEEPQPAPSQEPPSLDQDIPEQQEIEQAELTKGPPES